ncbi:MAG: hypothetical protein V3T05_14605 [Myxococcota bacterium]
MNIKELKARLSAYLRQVRRGETFLVTDRNQVVARLGPLVEDARQAGEGTTLAERLASAGARPPLRLRRPSDYQRTGAKPELSTTKIDELIDWARSDRV